MVLKESEFERVLTPGRPLSSIKFKGGVNVQNFMPAADRTWAWAHVHINDLVNNAPLTDHDVHDPEFGETHTHHHADADPGRHDHTPHVASPLEPR